MVLLSGILINLIILYSIYNFIMSRNSKKGRAAIVFLSSLVVLGIGIAFIVFGVSKINYIDNIENEEYYTLEYETLVMSEDLIFESHWYSGVEYIPSENEDIKIEIRHSNYVDWDLVKVEESTNRYVIQSRLKDDISEMDMYRVVLNDIKDLKIVDYGIGKVKVYTTEENIDKLRANFQNYYNQ